MARSSKSIRLPLAESDQVGPARLLVTVINFSEMYWTFNVWKASSSRRASRET